MKILVDPQVDAPFAVAFMKEVLGHYPNDRLTVEIKVAPRNARVHGWMHYNQIRKPDEHWKMELLLNPTEEKEFYHVSHWPIDPTKLPIHIPFGSRLGARYKVKGGVRQQVTQTRYFQDRTQAVVWFFGHELCHYLLYRKIIKREGRVNTEIMCDQFAEGLYLAWFKGLPVSRCLQEALRRTSPRHRGVRHYYITKERQ